jgi:hypothetical protein
MPRRRAAESVPDVEDDIEERIIRHTKTKRGIRTMEKVVPVLRKDKPAKPSKSKKGKQPPLETDIAEGSGGALPTYDDTHTPQFIDDQDDGFPDLGTAQGQAESKVCARLHL